MSWRRVKHHPGTAVGLADTKWLEPAYLAQVKERGVPGVVVAFEEPRGSPEYEGVFVTKLGKVRFSEELKVPDGPDTSCCYYGAPGLFQPEDVTAANSTVWWTAGARQPAFSRL